MKNVIHQSVITLVACLVLASTATANPPQVFDYVAKETRAIDRDHFTQGLLIWDEALWVSSGLTVNPSFLATIGQPWRTERSPNYPISILQRVLLSSMAGSTCSPGDLRTYWYWIPIQ